MGHRNIQFTGHVIDSETDQQGRPLLHPEPCIFYGSVPNCPQLANHSIVPAPGNQCNFNLHMPGHNDGTLFYGIPPYNALQPQHPSPNLDLAAAAVSSGHYNPYISAPPSEAYFRNMNHMDDFTLFKRKNAEGASSNHLYQNTAAGPSFPVPEPEIARMDSTSFVPPEYVGNDPISVVDNGPRRTARSMPGSFQPESALAHNASTMIRGNYIASPVQFPGNPWLNMRFGDISTFAWIQAPNLPYIHAGVNGACVEAGNVGVPCYQGTTINRTTAGFPHAHGTRAHSSPPHPAHPTPPMQGFRGNFITYPSQMATSSRRTSAINSNASAGPFHEVIDTGPTFLAPVPPAGFRLYQPQQQRGIIVDPSGRQRNHPHLRVLPEEEVAILEFQEFRDGEDSDMHRDMRLDIDHMSYEELLALGEHIGSVNTGLTEEYIKNNMKTKAFSSPAACVDIDRMSGSDQGKINFCVVCQTDYECKETVGILDCGHEYHRECITKWLIVKNTCPVCKSTALNGKAKKDL